MNVSYAGAGVVPEFFMNDVGTELHSEDGEGLYVLRQESRW